MQIGAMNNPHENVYKELERIGKAGCDFVDFTIEPEKCQPKDIDVTRAKRIMRKNGLEIVGHMGDWMLPKDTGYDLVRDACKKEMISALRVLNKLGAKKATFHAPDVKISNYELSKKRNTELIKELLTESKKLGITLMMENAPGTHEGPEELRLLKHIFNRFKTLKVHIDVGHTNTVAKSRFYTMYRKYGRRVEHLHFSDNHGSEDEHLALGEGNINWERVVKFLKNQGYDGTITLETFRSGKTGEKKSLKYLRKIWDAA